MMQKTIGLALYLSMTIMVIFCALWYIPLLLIFGPEKITPLARLYGRLVILAGGNKFTIAHRPLLVNGPYVFVMNHQSSFDIFMFAAVMPNHFSAIAKKELLSMPVFGYLIKKFGVITIDRQDKEDAKSSIAQAEDKLKAGISVLIFPEGTRTKKGNVGEFKKGAALIALATHAPIIPVGISGSYETRIPHSRLLRPAHLKINFGKAIYYTQYSKMPTAELTYYLRDQVINLIPK